MTFKEIRKSRWFKFFSNIYVLVLTVFVIWMLFFDANSWWFTHRELDKEIEKLGYELVPPEIAIYARSIYKEQPTMYQKELSAYRQFYFLRIFFT